MCIRDSREGGQIEAADVLVIAAERPVVGDAIVDGEQADVLRHAGPPAHGVVVDGGDNVLAIQKGVLGEEARAESPLLLGRRGQEDDRLVPVARTHDARRFQQQSDARGVVIGPRV